MMIGVLILSLLAVLPAAAQTAGWDAALAERGYGATSAERSGNRTIYRAQGSSGRRLSVDAPGELRSADAEVLLAMHDRIAAWQSLNPAVLSFTVETGQVRLHVLPSRFSEDGKDFLPFTPGGLSFTGSPGSIDYDFRLKADSYFIRFQGILTSERLVLERLKAAVSDPAQFIRDNDPAYAAFRIAELQGELAELQKRLDGAEAAIREGSAQAAALGERAATAESALAEQAAASDRLALAGAAALAKGAFGAPKPISPEVRDAVLRIRSENAAATSSEIGAALKTQGLAATDRQIKALLMVYFGE